jgi:hypothetical protein
MSSRRLLNIKNWPATVTAMRYYLLKKEEMDTLPYWEFPNEFNPNQPRRSYAHDGVKMVAYRKLAILAGLHKQDLKESELLKDGGEIFQ